MLNLNNIEVHHDIFLKMMLFTLQNNWKKGKRYKYETRAEIVALVEHNYIGLGKDYDMDSILEYVDMIDKHQCFDELFHRK